MMKRIKHTIINDKNCNKLVELFVEYEFDGTKTNENAIYADGYIFDGSSYSTTLKNRLLFFCDLENHANVCPVENVVVDLVLYTIFMSFAWRKKTTAFSDRSFAGHRFCPGG